MKKNEPVLSGQERNAARRAIKSLFPSLESFADFRDNDREISRQALPAIFRFAVDHQLIETQTEASFVAFLQRIHETPADSHFHEDMTFPDVLAALKSRQSVNALIVQMDKIARSLGLPAVSAAMITRLKRNDASGIESSLKTFFQRRSPS